MKQSNTTDLKRHVKIHHTQEYSKLFPNRHFKIRNSKPYRHDSIFKGRYNMEIGERKIMITHRHLGPEMK